eukprot:7594625-Pyramimonas_sp.AAC.3
MAEAVRDLPFVSCYIDDLIVFSTTVEEHMEHLRTVFERLKKVQMTLREWGRSCSTTREDFGHKGLANPKHSSRSKKLPRAEKLLQYNKHPGRGAPGLKGEGGKVINLKALG